MTKNKMLSDYNRQRLQRDFLDTIEEIAEREVKPLDFTTIAVIA